MLFAAAVLLGAPGCQKGDSQLPDYEDMSTGEALSHEMIVLGKKLDDPYSVSNMTKALSSLYPTKAITTLTPTDVYVRFLPKSEEEYDRLCGMGIEMLDHPLDYQIIRDGDYYHDPLIADDSMTWQYAVVPHGFALPKDITHEILDDCFISDHAATKASDIDWEAVERESFRMTGNGDLVLPQTKAGGECPKGRITIVDENYAGGKPFGVAGVKVVVNTFVKFASAYTDRDGYYEISKRYSSNIRYRLLFTNSSGFSIGFNAILIPASMSTLGKSYPSGLDAQISRESERKLFCRCVVNNAAYDYISRCTEEDMGISRPPMDLRIWIFQGLNSSSTVMLHHGTLLGESIFSKYLGNYSSLLAVFLPDITIGAKDHNDYASLYSDTVHELAHASHFAQVGLKFWNSYIWYIINSFIATGKTDYGDGTGDGAGICEIGEMWGYFMQNLMFNDRYGGTMPTAGQVWWFKPQIRRYLHDRGLSRSDIYAALVADVTDRGKLRDKLISLYPDRRAIIEQVFTRYAE